MIDHVAQLGMMMMMLLLLMMLNTKVVEVQFLPMTTGEEHKSPSDSAFHLPLVLGQALHTQVANLNLRYCLAIHFKAVKFCR